MAYQTQNNNHQQQPAADEIVESHSHLLGVDMDDASGQNANEDDVCETTDDGELDEHL